MTAGGARGQGRMLARPGEAATLTWMAAGSCQSYRAAGPGASIRGSGLAEQRSRSLTWPGLRISAGSHSQRQQPEPVGVSRGRSPSRIRVMGHHVGSRSSRRQAWQRTATPAGGGPRLRFAGWCRRHRDTGHHDLDHHDRGGGSARSVTVIASRFWARRGV